MRILSRAGAGCGGCEFDVEELIASEFVERTGSLSQRQQALRRVLIANRRIIEGQRTLLRAIRSAFRPRPAFYGTWWVERPDLHARINLCNVASPAAPTRVWPKAITLDLFTAEGKLTASRSVRLAPYTSQTFEVRDLLPKGIRAGTGSIRKVPQSPRTGRQALLRAPVQRSRVDVGARSSAASRRALKDTGRWSCPPLPGWTSR